MRSVSDKISRGNQNTKSIFFFWKPCRLSGNV